MNEESAFILQGSVSTTAVLFLQSAVLRMIPYSVAALPLIALDLVYGVKAARARGEVARFSTAIRRTITKAFTYMCWLILASTLALAFGQTWLEWVILGTVYANELSSIVGNYFESKGMKVVWKNILNAIFKLGGQKTGLDTEGIDAGSFVEPIQGNSKPRNSKGQFVSKK